MIKLKYQWKANSVLRLALVPRRFNFLEPQLQGGGYFFGIENEFWCISFAVCVNNSFRPQEYQLQDR